MTVLMIVIVSFEIVGADEPANEESNEGDDGVKGLNVSDLEPKVSILPLSSNSLEGDIIQKGMW